VSTQGQFRADTSELFVLNGYLTSVSCPSASFCVAVDDFEGNNVGGYALIGS
jgi:hypothetical protein